MSVFKNNFKLDNASKHIALDGVAAGYEPFALFKIANEIGKTQPIMFVARDGQKLDDLTRALGFIEAQMPVLQLPSCR